MHHTHARAGNYRSFGRAGKPLIPSLHPCVTQHPNRSCPETTGVCSLNVATPRDEKLDTLHVLPQRRRTQQSNRATLDRPRFSRSSFLHGAEAVGGQQASRRRPSRRPLSDRSRSSDKWFAARWTRSDRRCAAPRTGLACSAMSLLLFRPPPSGAAGVARLEEATYVTDDGRRLFRVVRRLEPLRGAATAGAGGLHDARATVLRRGKAVGAACAPGQAAVELCCRATDSMLRS